MPTSSEQSAQSPNPVAQSSTGSPAALKVLVWIAIGAVLYVGKPVFVPILFAVLLAMLLSPLVDLLELHRVPRMLASVLSVGILLATIVIAIDAAWSPTLAWIDDAPAILQKVEQKVRPLRRFIARIDSVTNRASSLTKTGSDRPATGATDSTSRVDALATARTVLIETASVAILTVFFLAIGARTLRRMESAFVNHGYRYQCMRVVEAVRHKLSRYFGTLALINIGLGIVITGVVTLWGLPSPWLWGMAVALLNFVPYVGPTVSLVLLTVVALVTFEGYSEAIGVAGSFLLVTTIEGQFVQPLLIGHRLNLNPIMVFVGIWLTGWFWGIAGVVLATPLLIALKEIADCQTDLSVMKALLSGQLIAADNEPTPSTDITITPALNQLAGNAPGDNPPTGARD